MAVVEPELTPYRSAELAHAPDLSWLIGRILTLSSIDHVRLDLDSPVPRLYAMQRVENEAEAAAVHGFEHEFLHSPHYRPLKLRVYPMFTTRPEVYPRLPLTITRGE